MRLKLVGGNSQVVFSRRRGLLFRRWRGRLRGIGGRGRLRLWLLDLPRRIQ
jgi:hypothetical protein